MKLRTFGGDSLIGLELGGVVARKAGLCDRNGRLPLLGSAFKAAAGCEKVGDLRSKEVRRSSPPKRL